MEIITTTQYLSWYHFCQKWKMIGSFGKIKQHQEGIVLVKLSVHIIEGFDNTVFSCLLKGFSAFIQRFSFILRPLRYIFFLIKIDKNRRSSKIGGYSYRLFYNHLFR